jgi:hypothetical protein
MTTLAVLLCGRRVADDAMSQTAGRQTLGRERAVMTMTIN